MSKKKVKPIKAYAFIDTNIFLDFYRSRKEASLSLLNKLESVKERVICTYQVEMEFLKNRQKVIIKNYAELSLGINDNLPAVLHDSTLHSKLKKEKKENKKFRKELQNKLANIISKPSLHDPVYKSLESIFSSKNNHVLTWGMKIRHEIEKLAWQRFLLGYPPRKNEDLSIGDALNWEWFIHCCKKLKGKFIIISRDSDYGSQYNGQTFLNDALKSEFRDRVGRKSIIYTTLLSEGLKHLDIPVSSDEEESEIAQINSLSPYPTDLQGVVSPNFFKLPELIDAIKKSQPNLKAFNTSGMDALKNVLARQREDDDMIRTIKNRYWKPFDNL